MPDGFSSLQLISSVFPGAYGKESEETCSPKFGGFKWLKIEDATSRGVRAPILKTAELC